MSDARTPQVEPTERLEAAVGLARRAHAGQVRKGTSIPYISHPLAVCALVIEDGGDEDEAVAALLHDVVEDTDVTLDQVAAGFGDRVAAIVRVCSDTEVRPKPPWRPRKEAYLARLPSHPDAWRVSLADKLHNARAIVADARRDGVGSFDRFNGGLQGTLWYYRELASFFADRCPGPMQRELDLAVAEMERLGGGTGQTRSARPG